MRNSTHHFSTEYSQRIKEMVTTIAAILIMLMLMVTISFDAVFGASKADIKESDIHSSGAVSFSGSTSQVVYGLHEDRKLPPGDLVKLMTAMVVIDNMHDDKEYNNIVTISSKADKLGDIYKKGQEVKVSDLLTAMLTRDSDEAAYALSLYSATKEEIFVSEMNSKAMELELMNTQFMNPTGKGDNNQYSSAYDIAVIAQYAMRYPFISEALRQGSGGGNINGFEGALSGTLNKAGKTYQSVMISRRDGMQIIAVSLGTTKDGVSREASLLTEYGHENASKDVIVKAGKKVGTVMVKHGAKVRVSGYTKTKGYAYVPPEGSTSLVQTRVVMQDRLKAPISKGTKIGEFRIYVADELKGTVDVVTNEDINTGWFPSYIYISNAAFVGIAAAAAALLFLFIRGRIRRAKRRRIKERQRQARIRELAMKQKAIEEDRARRNWTYH